VARPALEGRPVIHLCTGAVYVSDRRVAIRTLLGSCVSACLYDPVARRGGLNHFVLPALPGDTGTRYGFEAMEHLIEECVRIGALRSRLQAKVFGGGHMIGGLSGESVSSRNIAFIRRFLEAAEMPIAAEQLGGEGARELYFFPDNGRTFVRHISGSMISRRIRSQDDLMHDEVLLHEISRRRIA
jgi:chemotaxis protein CheD